MAGAYGTYVLEMGRPVRITDLARKMIEIRGAPNVRIKFIGLRPGEKLKEELFEEGEERRQTDHLMVFRLVSENMSPSEDPALSEVVDTMALHAKSAGGGQVASSPCAGQFRNLAADLPETRQEGT